MPDITTATDPANQLIGRLHKLGAREVVCIYNDNRAGWIASCFFERQHTTTTFDTVCAALEALHGEIGGAEGNQTRNPSR